MKVGDKLWYVPSDSRHDRPDGHEKTITKVGRKYFYVDNGYHPMKCELWNYNSYAIAHIVEYPYGSLYPNEQEYLAFKKWNKLPDINRMKLNRDQKERIVAIIEEGNDV